MRHTLLAVFATIAVASTTIFSISQSHVGITLSVILGLSVSHHSFVSAFALPRNLVLDARHENHNLEDDTDIDDSGDTNGRQRNGGSRGNGTANGRNRNGNGNGNGGANDDSDRRNRNRNGTADATRGDGNDKEAPATGRPGAGDAGSGGNNVDGIDSGAGNATDDNSSFNGSSGGNNVDGVNTDPDVPVTPGLGANNTASSGGNNVDGLPSTGSQRDTNGTSTRTGNPPLTTGTDNTVGRNSTSSGSDSSTGDQAGTGTLPAGFPPAVPGPDFVAGERKRSVEGLPRAMMARRDYQVNRKFDRAARMKIPVSPKRDIYRNTYDI